MRTAEEILEHNLYNKFDEVDKKTFISAMEQYAKEVIEHCAKQLVEPFYDYTGQRCNEKLQAVILKQIDDLK